jgi:hypothetical protein
MKAKKESVSYRQEPTRHPVFAAPLPATQPFQGDDLTEEDFAEVITGWERLPRLKKKLLRKNIEISINPGDSPQNANIHSKTMVALFPEFREKKDKQVFTPADYKKVWEEAFESSRRGDKIIGYAEHYGKKEEEKEHGDK